MKTKNKNLALGAYLIFLVIFLTNFASANFVCGEVENSLENISASWFPVSLYYGNTPNLFTTCDVSPEGNKFCCDASSIPPINSWNPGDIVEAEVYSAEYGFSAGPVSLISTSEGYDVLPKMKLEKVINIISPTKKLFINPNETFNLTASFKPPYTEIELYDHEGFASICGECTNISIERESQFGMNTISLVAKDDRRNFTEIISFAQISNFSLSRSLDCKSCRKNRVRSGKEFKITLNLNLSHEVSDLELKEYVPVAFDIINTTGDIETYSETHNIIKWKINGSNLSKEYLLKSPDLRVRAKKYIFKTDLEDKELNNEEIRVYRFFNFFYKKPIKIKISSFEKLDLKTNIYPNKPLVVEPNNFVTKVAIFPNKKVRNVKFRDKSYGIELNSKKPILIYKFETNIPRSRVEKVYIEYKLDKILIKNPNDYSIYYLQRGRWNERIINYSNEDENYFYYQDEEGIIQGISVVKFKKSFFRRFS